uniref:Phosphate-selective porin n=1 Tax=uncultured Acidobacteria bacterium A3 TaxID=1036853 RepID=F8TTI8_9BACT|nr:phosphate-selective porin [uncultured Acidobacteria bacterium A3]
MLIERVRTAPSATVCRGTAALLASSLFVLLIATPLRAQDAPLPPISIGAGARTSFVHTDPDDGKGTDAFLLDSLRLYVSGSVTKNIKFMVNTEYDGNNHIDVMDAVAQFEFSPKFNIWAGRFLPPSDRANMYGPYYAHHWAVFTDGVQDGYPGVFQGRDNGAMYWGQFGKVKVSGGGFDGMSATGRKTVIGAGRVQVDFWDPEAGYYLNGTYYGGKNLLAIGVAGQVQGDDNHASSVDFLLERKVGTGGAFSIESEFAKYDRLGGYNSRYNTDTGGYLLASFLFPTTVGVGRFEVLGKFAKASFTNGLNAIDRDYDQKTSELNLNYVIKEFNARVMVFFLDKRFNAVQSNYKQFGVGLQLQM